MRYAKIVGTGSALPNKVVTNDDLAQHVATSDEWVMQRVGIKSRRVVSGNETVSHLAEQASVAALSAAGLEANEIDLIIVATVSSEYNFPAVATWLQQRLNITNGSPAYDISAACAGFIYAMNTADLYIKSGQVKNALIVGAEALTKMVDWQDRTTCVLFGDGAGAVVLQASEEPGVLATTLKSDGQHSDRLYCHNDLWQDEGKNYIQMQGKEVFKWATTKLGEVVTETLAKAALPQTAIDWLIPHQANKRIIDATAKKLGMSQDKVVYTIEEHGNTSAASVPLALDVAVRDGRVQRGEVLLLEAFGAGFVWGASLVRY